MTLGCTSFWWTAQLHRRTLGMTCAQHKASQLGFSKLDLHLQVITWLYETCGKVRCPGVSPDTWHSSASNAILRTKAQFQVLRTSLAQLRLGTIDVFLHECLS